MLLFNDRLIHSSTPNNSNGVRWSADLRYQPTDQDPMPQHGAGWLAALNIRKGFQCFIELASPAVGEASLAPTIDGLKNQRSTFAASTPLLC